MAERSIVLPGSSSVHVRESEARVAELIACGFPHKKVANRLGISVRTVHVHVYNLAQRIPGDAAPTLKVAVWWLTNHGSDE